MPEAHVLVLVARARLSVEADSPRDRDACIECCPEQPGCVSLGVSLPCSPPLSSLVVKQAKQLDSMMSKIPCSHKAQSKEFLGTRSSSI